MIQLNIMQELLDKIELQKEQEEKKREDELLEMGRPDAPEPNSLYKLNRSSLSSTTNSQVKIERRSSKVNSHSMSSYSFNPVI